MFFLILLYRELKFFHTKFILFNFAIELHNLCIVFEQFRLIMRYFFWQYFSP